MNYPRRFKWYDDDLTVDFDDTQSGIVVVAGNGMGDYGSSKRLQACYYP